MSHEANASFIAYWRSCSASGNRSQLTRREPSAWQIFFVELLFSHAETQLSETPSIWMHKRGDSELLVDESLEFNEVSLWYNASEIGELANVVGDVTAGQLLRPQKLRELGWKRIALAHIRFVSVPE